ncbi:geranylgeranyl diphosphate synthase 1 [Tieghemostelium lacteum]|uniref:Geranylgeranyl diphosphate synthase 1 n=1 Tax=Tieghemostelium lacteum TaxID=361077 RepID=A0A152A290_TIELA|nr:geranylgeranyl diphosphate synthase 1 [Tieghemostelium lacteum]|eukprot:KYR00358.1 geranylgeranyl diphosphate synthase 1 [Tieghemostelium lacteum]
MQFSYPLNSGDYQLVEPYKYICESSGKGFRNMLIQAFDYWLQVGETKVKEIGTIVQGLHMASLLIDDIEDNSKLRRGNPAAHIIYGIPQTINSANFIYFLMMDHCIKLGDPQACNIFVEEVVRLHRGQGYDIMWRDTNKCPTEEEYYKMVSEKTGGLFRLGLRLLQTFSNNKTDYSEFIENLGLYYQIRDDYINLVSSEYQQNKSFCEDITEGKFSFPIINAINKDKNDNRLLLILKQKTESVEVKQYALDYIIKMGSIEYTKTIIENLRTKILKQIEDLGGNPILIKMLESLESKKI